LTLVKSNANNTFECKRFHGRYAYGLRLACEPVVAPSFNCSIINNTNIITLDIVTAKEGISIDLIIFLCEILFLRWIIRAMDTLPSQVGFRVSLDLQSRRISIAVCQP